MKTLLLLFSTVFLVGCGREATPTAATTNNTAWVDDMLAGAHAGRYQVIQARWRTQTVFPEQTSSGVTEELLRVDTATGKTWRYVEFTTETATKAYHTEGWEPVPEARKGRPFEWDIDTTAK